MSKIACENDVIDGMRNAHFSPIGTLHSLAAIALKNWIDNK